MEKSDGKETGYALTLYVLINPFITLVPTFPFRFAPAHLPKSPTFALAKERANSVGMTGVEKILNVEQKKRVGYIQT